MITTIQIHENAKKQLDRMKTSEKKTYEEVILGLIKMAEQGKRNQKALLIESYKEMAEESLDLTNEWSSADRSWE